MRSVSVVEVGASISRLQITAPFFDRIIVQRAVHVVLVDFSRHVYGGGRGCSAFVAEPALRGEVDQDDGDFREARWTGA